MRKTPVEDRFFDKVEKTDSCWVWTAARKGKGYGGISVDGVMKSAHRIAYKIFVGPIPDGLFVLHKCDNRLCVNPEHLFLGTNQDNMDDMNRKGRHRTDPPVGERSGHTKLRDSDVREIVRLFSTGEFSQQQIADRYGVNQSQISRMVHKKTWCYL